MSVSVLLAVTLMGQSAFSLAQEPALEADADVGYEELAQNRPQDAIARIEAGHGAQSNDPAALINLGNAYARLGDTAKAMRYYRAAAASDEQYELELADGRWMDSRIAARRAITALANSGVLATRD